MACGEKISFVAFQKEYADEGRCREHLFQKRWPNGFVCPKCGGAGCYTIKGRKEYVCKRCHKHISVTSGTVMHGSHLPLTVWFWAAFLVSRDKRGYSAKRLSEELDLSYHTAWYLLSRLRRAMSQRDAGYRLSGSVEMDETFYGAPGKSGKHGRGTGKASILVVLSKEKDSIPCFLKMKVAGVDKESIRKMLCTNVKAGSVVQTDGLNLYRYALGEEYPHEIYPSGSSDPTALRWIHIVISNLKAFLLGTFHGVGAKYLQLYLDEFSFRFNRRHQAHSLFDALLTALSHSAILCPVDPK